MNLEINRKNCRIWSMLGMRRTVGYALRELALQNRDVIIATADLARYMGGEDFTDTIPDQFIDVGISEQNLIGVAAGMQMEGFRVFAGTYATFITARCLDQIRMNMGYMGIPIKLIGVAGGLSDGRFGPSHMALEDVADMRSIPQITIISPADCAELVKVVTRLLDYDRPTYLRLTGATGMPMVYLDDFEYQIGKANKIRDGKDIAIVAAGVAVYTGLQVAEMLSDVGVSCSVIDMHTISPIDEKMLDEISKYSLIVSIEEHRKSGGLGSAIAEYYAEYDIRPKQMMIAIEGNYPVSADYPIIIKKEGLDAESITDRIIKLLNI